MFLMTIPVSSCSDYRQAFNVRVWLSFKTLSLRRSHSDWSNLSIEANLFTACCVHLSWDCHVLILRPRKDSLERVRPSSQYLHHPHSFKPPHIREPVLRTARSHRKLEKARCQQREASAAWRNLPAQRGKLSLKRESLLPWVWSFRNCATCLCEYSDVYYCFKSYSY